MADLEIWFQNWWQMMGKIWAKITMHSYSFEELFSNLAYCETPTRKVLRMMIVEFNILLMQIKIQIKSAHEFAHCGTCFACHVT